VEEIIILTQRYSQRFAEYLSTVLLLEMEVQPLKYVEKAEFVSRSC
jgi:hypothetical protein